MEILAAAEMSEIATTGKCGNSRCGHALSAHDKKNSNICEHKNCKCEGYIAVVDVAKYNTLDGKPAIELYEFQKQYLQGLPAKYIFAADTGTGKTYMALAHYDKHAYLKPLLVIAPAAKVSTGDWEREIKAYFAGRMVPEFEVWSYEKFSRTPTPKQMREGNPGVWRSYIADHSTTEFAMIVDEVHKAKNPQSGAGKRIFETSLYAGFFVGLSATPLPNGWIDVANYFKIFGFSKNITEFKEKYCDYQYFKTFPELVGYRNEAELQSLWNKIAKPLDKQAALDLPSVTWNPVSLSMGTKYVKVAKERMFGDKFLDNPSAMLHALRQSIIEPKVVWLNSFLEGVSDNVVVFYNYVEERNQILAMIEKSHKGRTVFRQDGEKHEVPGKDTWGQLQRTITLAQYQSGSTGIELTYCATTVYFSPTYSYSNFEQSIGRTNRHGQKQKMSMYLLCAPKTLEKAVWAALKNKQDFQEKQWYEDQLKSIDTSTNKRDTIVEHETFRLDKDDIY